MQLSVIIPCLNEQSTIVRCLQSLSDLRRAGVEVIVVDGGSVDRTVELASPLCDRLIASRAGRALQMNAGAQQAMGRQLLFLHADTVLPADIHDWLETVKLQQPAWGFFPVRLSGEQWGLHIIGRMMSWRSRLTSVATGDQCQFVRRSLFQALGGYAPIALMEDIEFSKRLRRHAPPAIWRSPVITSGRLWQQRGVLQTVARMWWLRLAYCLGVPPQTLHRWYYGDGIDSAGRCGG